jgi:hypothetical protein
VLLVQQQEQAFRSKSDAQNVPIGNDFSDSTSSALEFFAEFFSLCHGYPQTFT